MDLTGAALIDGFQPAINDDCCYYDIVSEPGPNPELGVSHFPVGSGQVRLLQYTSTISCAKPEKDYWREYVENYFVPDCILRYQVWSPETHENRVFDLPAQSMAIMLHLRYMTTMRSMRMHLGRTNEFRCNHTEYPPDTPAHYGGNDYRHETLGTTHVVESDQVQQLVLYKNGWLIQRICTLRAYMVPYTRAILHPDPVTGEMIPRLQTQLRIKHLFFGCLNQLYYIHDSALNIMHMDCKIPPEIVAKITADARKGYTRCKDEPDVDTQQLTYRMEFDECKPRGNLSSLDEFPDSIKRVLEISDSISMLTPLMDIHLREGKGPLQILRDFSRENKDEKEAAPSTNDNRPFRSRSDNDSFSLPTHGLFDSDAPWLAKLSANNTQHAQGTSHMSVAPEERPSKRQNRGV